MILACPACGASFRIDAGKLGESGRTVRCSKCKHTWHARPQDGAEEGAAPTAAPAPASSAAPDDQRAGRGAEAAGAPGEPGEPGAQEAAPDFAHTLRASRYRPYVPEEEPAPRRGRGALILGWLLLAAAVIGVTGAGWAFREQVVAQVPQAAVLYRLAGVEVSALGAGLELRDVGRARRLVDGESELVIQGRVVNTTGQPKRTPRIEVTLYDAAGDVLTRWAFAAEDAEVPPGGATRFETRRSDPPDTAREFALSFARPADDTGSAAAQQQGGR
jgi:predicted Zn finger-like uncharacterized protein